MKACVLTDIGKLEYMDVVVPNLEKHQVLLKVKACGICSSDINRIYKTGTYHFPTIPGHEFAGEIVKTGEKANKDLLGKNVVVYPLRPCFSCNSCKEEVYERCENYSYYGSRCDGAFAEYLAVDEWNVLPYESIEASAAAMCEPAAVALHAVEKADVQKNSNVAIIGTGTIGFLSAMWARIKGARNIVIIGRNDEKRKFAEKLGFMQFINSNDENEMKKVDTITDYQGIDVVFECVGTNESLQKAILLTNRGGKLVLIGNPATDMYFTKDLYWKIIRYELQIIGSWNSSFSVKKNDWKTALKYMQLGDLPIIKLVTDTYELKDYQKALDKIMDINTVTVKVMFVFS